MKEQGTHEELIAQHGLYYDMYHAQSNGTKESHKREAFRPLFYIKTAQMRSYFTSSIMLFTSSAKRTAANN